MMTSSNAAFPARSPNPFMQPSICLAPFSTAASEFATDIPRSLWQCTLTTAWSMLDTFSKTPLTNAPNSLGFEYPTVSGMFTVVAPALIAASNMAYRYSGTVRVASIGENSTSSTYVRAISTASTAMFMIVSRSLLIWCIRCTSDDEMKVWMRGRVAPWRDFAAASMSDSTARASEQMTGPSTS